MAKKMRTVQGTVKVRGKVINFDLACDPNTRFEEGQLFEIVAPKGHESLTGRVLRGQVVNRSNGTTSFAMAVDDSPMAVHAILLGIPEVSNIKYK